MLLSAARWVSIVNRKEDAKKHGAYICSYLVGEIEDNLLRRFPEIH